jgi:hypothetical protein
MDLRANWYWRRSLVGSRAAPRMYPFLNKAATGPPIITDSEGGELAVPEQPVNRRPMDPQKVRQLIGGQQFVVWHFGCFHFQGGFTFGREVTLRAGPTTEFVPERWAL